MDEQREHINLDKLISAYNQHDDINTKLISDFNDQTVIAKLRESLLNVGKAQRDIPRHMLKEFFRSGSSWAPDSSFDVENNIPPTKSDVVDSWHFGLFCERIYGYINVLPFIPHKGLGIDYALINAGHD